MKLIPVKRVITGLCLVSAVTSLAAWQFLAMRNAKTMESPATAVQEFIEQTPVLRRITLDPVIPELMQSSAALPRTHKYRFSDIQLLKKLADKCEIFPNPPPELLKAAAFHQARCDGEFVFDDHFFESPPWMHPSGVSFAALVLESNPAIINQDWISKRERQFHVRELGRIPLNFKLAEPFDTIRAFDEGAIKALEYGLPSILDHRLVLIQDFAKSQSFEFLVFDRKDWNRFFVLRGTDPKNFSSQVRCSATRYNICMEPAPIIRYLNWLFFVLATLSAVMMVLRWSEVRRSLRKREEEELQSRQTVVSILGHELRTPVASMLVNLEILRQGFDQFNTEVQDAVLRIFSEANRLQHIIRGSEDFLRASVLLADELPPFCLVSLEDIFVQLAEKYQFQRSGIERPILKVRGTREWVEICIRNLLENAVRHGKGTVRVLVSETANDIMVAISDEGQWVGTNIDASRPFLRSQSAQGMGLGLYVSRQLMRQMGGDLDIRNFPTTVILRWPYRDQ